MYNVVLSVENFLNKYNMSPKKVLVGFSGGCDSAVLTYILHSLGFDVIAIHLNHNWRNEESIRDEEFCREFAKKTGVEFYSEKLNGDVKKTESDARDARYDFFSRCAKKFNTDVVFLAHNMDDNAQTLLYRVIKGTGLCGLCAIPQVRDIFYRPLLNVSRGQIEDFALRNAIDYVNDSSNFDTKYSRNYIRYEILPKLKKINPDVVQSLNNMAQLSKMQYSIVKNALNAAKKEVFVDNTIIIKKFAALDEAMQYEIVNDFLFDDLKYRDFIRIKSYVDFILYGKGKKSVNGELFLEITDGRAIKTPAVSKKHEEEIKITGPGSYKFGKYLVTIEPSLMPDKFFAAGNVHYLNCDFKDVVLRTRREGDVFSPFGMSGKMKLKEYLINKKIARHKRDNLLLLAHNNEILCILGVQISQNAAVNQNSSCYRIEFSE